MKHRTLSDDQVAQVLRLHAAGLSARRIAEAVGSTRRTVGRVIAGASRSDAPARAPGARAEGDPTARVVRSASASAHTFFDSTRPGSPFARSLLAMYRGHDWSDEEFADAERRLADRLHRHPDEPWWESATCVGVAVTDEVASRRRVEQQQRDAAERRARRALVDLDERLGHEERYVRRRVEAVDDESARASIMSAFHEEADRARAALSRRLRVAGLALSPEVAVDEVVRDLVARVERLIPGGPR